MKLAVGSLIASAFFVVPTWAHSQEVVLVLGIAFGGLAVALAVWSERGAAGKGRLARLVIWVFGGCLILDAAGRLVFHARLLDG